MAQSSGIKKIGVTKLKSTLMKPALTSHYQCEFPPPSDSGLIAPGGGELLSLSCSDASLPGSSLATIDIQNDFKGVTERHGYRLIYDDRADFQFYVDSDYKIIQFFENWILYVIGGGNERINNKNYSYGVKFPEQYKTNIMITKFERDLSGTGLKYTFVDAFPTSINSMPVSYDASQLLKVTVSFSYTRYYISQTSFESVSNSEPTGDDVEGGTREVENNNRFEPPTPKTFLGTPLNSQQTLTELYNAGFRGQIKTAGDFVGPLQ